MTRRDMIAEARRLLALAWPIALTNLQWMILNITDTALVGLYSTAEAGELAAGRTIMYVTVVMGLAGLTGVLVFAGRADGAGDKRAAGDALRQGLALALVAGTLVMALILLTADWMVGAFGVPEALRPGGAEFARVMALALPFQLAFAATSYFMEGISRPRVAMRINLAAIPVNGLLAWMLISGQLGLPALGATGAGLGTAITSVLQCVVLLVLVHRMPDAEAFGLGGARVLARWRRAWADGGPLRRFALVPALSAAFEVGGFSFLLALSTRFGAEAAGAFQIVIALHMISLAASAGLASAAGVRVANALGEGKPDEARPRALLAAGLAAFTLLVFGVLYFAAAGLLVAPFSEDPAVVALGVVMLRILAPFLVADGVQFVFLYSLRSLGDQKVAGYISVACFFGVMTAAGWWLATRGGLGPEGLIIGFVIGIVAAAIGLGLRFLAITRAPERIAVAAD